MSTTTDSEFHSELLREADIRGQARGEARGEARGRALGEAQAVLTVLDARGVPVSEAIREQILTCTDLTQLDTWLRRVATAATADEVIHP